jgi:hypothetical protein
MMDWLDLAIGLAVVGLVFAFGMWSKTFASLAKAISAALEAKAAELDRKGASGLGRLDRLEMELGYGPGELEPLIIAATKWRMATRTHIDQLVDRLDIERTWCESWGAKGGGP